MRRPNTSCAFTLVELLVASAVLVILLTLLLGVTSNMSSLWQRAEGQKFRHQAARSAIAGITRDLESMVLTTNAADVRLRVRLNPPLSGYTNPTAAFWTASVSDSPGAGDLAEVGYFVRWETNSEGHPTPELRRLSIPANDLQSIFSDTNRPLDASLLEEFAPGSGHPDQRGLVARHIAGLWVTFFDSSGNPLPVGYDSAAGGAPPASAEVAFAIFDPRTLARLPDASAITSHYSADVDTFVSNLTEPARSGVRIFRSRVSLLASP